MADYQVTRDKVLVHHQSALYDGWIECSDIDTLKTYADPDTKPVEGISTWKAEKIPAELIGRVLGTLARYPHMETGYVIYRDPIRAKWDIRCPEQKGSAAHVNFFEEAHPDDSFQVVGTIHIHPQMGAFWSGTDMADQTKKPGTLHMVFGTSGTHVTQTLCTVFEKGTHYDIPFEDVCEAVDFLADHEADEEWCGIIDKQSWKPAVPVAPTLPSATIASPYPGYGFWSSPSSVKSTPVRQTYDDYMDDYDLAGSTRGNRSYKSYEGIIDSLAATVGYAVDEYGLNTVLNSISEALGVDLTCDTTGTKYTRYNDGLDDTADTLCDEPAYGVHERMSDLLDAMVDDRADGGKEWITAMKESLEFAADFCPDLLQQAAEGGSTA